MDSKNADEEDTCEWSTSAIQIKDGEINFGNTTFTGLGDGALFVGAGAKVTLSPSSQLYGNKPSITNGRMTNFQRNIVCDGGEDNKAQLNAQVESFIEKGKEVEQDEIIINRWILRNPKTCNLLGSVANENNLLYTPLIDGIETKQPYNTTGIQVVVTGKQLFGCRMIWLNISGQTQTSNDEITKSYNFEEIAQDWANNTEVQLLIPFDDELVIKGNKIQILALVGETADSAIKVPSSKGGSIEVEEIEIPPDTGSEPPPGPGIDPDTTDTTKDSKGISTGAIIGIIIGVIAAIVVIVIIVVILLYCNMKSSKSKRAHHEQTSKSQIRNTYTAHQGSGRRARHYEMEENYW
ncbi:MAG: hypothetical protein EZS28_036437 [Streblomastix strix]|uniref:Uncharacterized protein n=1 Tax=Streblomastix strix TaxID=222440 RepID=A0A5J4UB54_9EUKA|nr:MAG: hypothetical protein EZS28_036437 [Streblomastix strix]